MASDLPIGAAVLSLDGRDELSSGFSPSVDASCSFLAPGLLEACMLAQSASTSTVAPFVLARGLRSFPLVEQARSAPLGRSMYSITLERPTLSPSVPASSPSHPRLLPRHLRHPRLGLFVVFAALSG